MASKEKVHIMPADEAQSFLALTAIGDNGSSITDVLAENVGPHGITPADLERVKVPTGGATFWTIPSAEGDAAIKTVEGVVLHSRDVRGYWPDKFAGANVPPVCASQDGEIGICTDEALSLGGECAKCPMAQWGTATDEKGSPTSGQACKTRRLLLVLSVDSPLPRLLSVPPSSLKSVRQYAVRLSGQAKRLSEVLTAFELTKTKSRTGIEFSQVAARKVRDLDPEEVVAITKYAKAILPAFQAARIENDAAE